MFGGLWGKKKEPTVLGGKSNGVPGMPAGLYSSKDVENLRFHDKRRVWYDAKQVDDALDKVQATLEWWESKSGLKPGSGTEPTEVSSKVDSGMEAGPGSPLDIDVDHLAVHDEAGSKPVLSGQVQSGVEHTVDVAPKPPRPAPVAEPADKRAGTTLTAGSAGKPTAVADHADVALASTTAISPIIVDSSGGHESAFSASRAKPAVDAAASATGAIGVADVTSPAAAADATRPGAPVPTFDLDTIAPHMAVGAGKAVDGVVRIGEPASKKPLEELAGLASNADSAKPAHAAPSIPLPEVPSVPVIPTNPFLRRR